MAQDKTPSRLARIARAAVALFFGSIAFLYFIWPGCIPADDQRRWPNLLIDAKGVELPLPQGLICRNRMNVHIRADLPKDATPGEIGLMGVLVDDLRSVDLKWEDWHFNDGQEIDAYCLLPHPRASNQRPWTLQLRATTPFRAKEILWWQLHRRGIFGEGYCSEL